MPSSTSTSNSNTKRKSAKTTNQTKSTKSTKASIANKTEPNTEDTRLAVLCDQSTLRDALSFVAFAIPANPTHPMLSNVLLVADYKQQQLSLSSYNLEFGMTVSIEANIASSGQISLPHKLFSKIVDKFLPGEISLTSTLDTPSTEQEVGSIRAVLSTPTEPENRFEFFTNSNQEFPSLPTVSKKLVTLSGSQLMAQLSASLFAASNDETKQILNGSQLTFEYHSKDKRISLTTWTTDAYRLVRTQGFQEYKSRTKLSQLSKPVSLVVPTKVLKELCRQLNPTDKVSVYFESLSSSPTQAGTVLFKWNNKSLISRTIEGQYPECQGVIDAYKPQYNRTFICERLALLKALERFVVLSDKSAPSIAIRLDALQQKATLSLERQSVGKGTEVVPIQLEGEELEFLYNVRYFYEVVKATATEHICFHLANANVPSLITPHGMVDIGNMTIEAEYILAPMQSSASKST